MSLLSTNLHHSSRYVNSKSGTPVSSACSTRQNELVDELLKSDSYQEILADLKFDPSHSILRYEMDPNQNPRIAIRHSDGREEFFSYQDLCRKDPTLVEILEEILNPYSDSARSHTPPTPTSEGSSHTTSQPRATYAAMHPAPTNCSCNETLQELIKQLLGRPQPNCSHVPLVPLHSTPLEHVVTHQAEMNSLQQQILHLQSRLSDLEAIRSSKDSELNQAHEANRCLYDQLAEMNAQNADFVAQLDQLRDEQIPLMDELEQTRATLEAKQSELSALQEEYANGSQITGQLTEQLQKQEALIQEMRGNLTQMQAQLQQSQSGSIQIEEKLHAAENSQVDLRQQLDEALRALLNAIGKNRASEAEIFQLEHAIADQETRYSSLENELTAHANSFSLCAQGLLQQISSLEMALADSNTHGEAFASCLQAAKDQCTTLQEQLASSNQQLEKANMRCTTYEQTLQYVFQAATASTLQNEEFREQISQLSNQIETSRQEKEALLQANAALQAAAAEQLSGLHAKLQKELTANDSLHAASSSEQKAALALLQSEFEQVNASLSSLVVQLAESQTAQATLLEQLEEAKQAASANEEERSALQEQVQTQGQTIAQLSLENEMLKGELAAKNSETTIALEKLRQELVNETAKLAALQEAQSHAQAKNDEQQALVATLESTVAGLQGQVASTQKLLAQHEIEKADLLAEQTALQARVEELNRQNDAAKDENGSLIQQVQELQASALDKDAENQSLADQLEDANAELAELRGTLQRRENQAVAVQNQFESQLSSYEAQIAFMEKALEKSELAHQQSEEASDLEMQRLQGLLEEKDFELQKLRGELASKRLSFNKNKNEIETLRAQLVGLDSEKASYEEKSIRTQLALQDALVEIAALEAQNRESEGQQADLQSALSQKEAQLTQSQQSYQEAMAYAPALLKAEEEKAWAVDKANTLQAQYEQLQKSTLAKERKLLQEIEEKDGAISELKEQAHTLQEQLAEELKHRQSLAADKNTLQSRIDQLQTENEEQREEIKQLQAEVARLNQLLQIQDQKIQRAQQDFAEWELAVASERAQKEATQRQMAELSAASEAASTKSASASPHSSAIWSIQSADLLNRALKNKDQIKMAFKSLILSNERSETEIRAYKVNQDLASIQKVDSITLNSIRVHFDAKHALPEGFVSPMTIKTNGPINPSGTRLALFQNYVKGPLATKIRTSQNRNLQNKESFVGELGGFLTAHPQIGHFITSLFDQLNSVQRKIFEQSSAQGKPISALDTACDEELIKTTVHAFHELLSNKGVQRSYVYGAFVHLRYLLDQVPENKDTLKSGILRTLFKVLEPLLKETLLSLEFEEPRGQGAGVGH